MSNDNCKFSEIINETLFFKFMNKKVEEFDYDFIYKELFCFHCGINPTALSVNDNEIIPKYRKLLFIEVQKPTNGLMRRKSLINHSKRIKNKIESILNSKQPISNTSLSIKAIQEKLAKRLIKIGKIEGISNFSDFNDEQLRAIKSIDSFGPSSFVLLERITKEIRKDPAIILKYRQDFLVVQNVFKLFLISISDIETKENDSFISSQKVISKWDEFLNSKLCISSFEEDFKNILRSLNELSKRDSDVYKRIKLCKFHNQGCSKPFFYSHDSAQVTCMSDFCTNKNRKLSSKSKMS